MCCTAAHFHQTICSTGNTPISYHVSVISFPICRLERSACKLRAPRRTSVRFAPHGSPTSPPRGGYTKRRRWPSGKWPCAFNYGDNALFHDEARFNVYGEALFSNLFTRRGEIIVWACLLSGAYFRLRTVSVYLSGFSIMEITLCSQGDNALFHNEARFNVSQLP